MTYNRYTALSDDQNFDHLLKVATDSTPKPPPIFVSDVITIPLLLQLLDQIVKQPYEIKALAGNQVRIQPKTPNSYRNIIKALAEKNMAVHTYKPKYECNYRVVHKNMHFSINPADIQSGETRAYCHQYTESQAPFNQAPPPDVLRGSQTRHEKQTHL
jgi:hypothetical protein